MLPPVALLSPAQAMYHFLSGYTARVAGTEKDLGKEPQATFSTCFGAPFLPRPPATYASLLGDYLKSSGATCWLVNTGWTGGPYGVGRRISIRDTRAILKAIMEGTLRDMSWHVDARFRFSIPATIPGVPSEVVDPARSWPDPAAYERQADMLAARFAENFRQFEGEVSAEVRAEGIGAALQ